MRRSVRRNERGAVLVEAALAGSLVFFLLFMVFEGGLFARSFLAASDAASAGARAAGVSAQDPLADFDVLRAVDRSMSAGSRKQIKKIVVFRAVGPDFSIPSTCLSAPGPTCNHYSAADLSMSEAAFSDTAFVRDDYWPSTARTGLNEKVGVYIQLDSGTLGGPLPGEITKASIWRIEATA